MTRAACGRYDEHGGHWDHARRRPCAGNRHIVTAVDAVGDAALGAVSFDNGSVPIDAEVLGFTAETWAARTDHAVIVGLASRANAPRGARERCHAVTDPGQEWPGNRLCHLPIRQDGAAWRHETFGEFAVRIGR